MDPLWNPEVAAEDARFTERQQRFEWLYEQAQLAQFSPGELAEVGEPDLIYLAGHVTAPPGIDGLRWSKLRMNAERASQELQRRWAAAEAGKSRRASFVMALLALIVSVTSLIFALADPPARITNPLPSHTTP